MTSIVRRASVLLALGLGACTQTIVPPQPPTPFDEEQAEAELAEAVALLEQAEADGRLDPEECTSVTTAFRAAHDPKQPATANALFNAGVVWERCGDPAQAKTAYADTIAANDGHSGAHNNLGVLQWNAGKRKAAAASFESAVQADATSPSARNNLAAALRVRYLESNESGDFERAELALRNALAVDSDNPVSLENLARLYYDRGRAQDRSYLLLAGLVITQGNRVLEEQSRPSAELYNLHGLLLMEDGDQVAALRAFKKATTIDDAHSEAHLNIAMIALRFRDYATAEASLDKALRDQRHEADVTALLGLGVAQRGQRRYDDAEKTLVRAQQLDTGDPRALYNLGILYHEHIAPTRSQVVTDEAKGEVAFDDEPYLDARRFFERFAKTAGGRYPKEVADANMRVASIDQFLEDIKELGELEKERQRMEALMIQQQEEERQRLLDIEAKAKAAAQGT